MVGVPIPPRQDFPPLIPKRNMGTPCTLLFAAPLKSPHIKRRVLEYEYTKRRRSGDEPAGDRQPYRLYGECNGLAAESADGNGFRPHPYPQGLRGVHAGRRRPPADTGCSCRYAGPDGAGDQSQWPTGLCSAGRPLLSGRGDGKCDRRHPGRPSVYRRGGNAERLRSREPRAGRGQARYQDAGDFAG